MLPWLMLMNWQNSMKERKRERERERKNHNDNLDHEKESIRIEALSLDGQRYYQVMIKWQRKGIHVNFRSRSFLITGIKSSDYFQESITFYCFLKFILFLSSYNWPTWNMFLKAHRYIYQPQCPLWRDISTIQQQQLPRTIESSKWT